MMIKFTFRSAMPKKTYTNLPEEKRRQIETAAIDEFAEQGYEAASVTRIASKAEISKGSFYQYFTDKRDLFLHLLHLSSAEQADFFSRHIPSDPQMDLFARLRWMAEEGFAFDVQHTHLNRAIGRVLFGEGLFIGEVFSEARAASQRAFTELVKQSAQRGEVDPQIDVEVAGFLLEVVMDAVGLKILNDQCAQMAKGQGIDRSWLVEENSRKMVEGTLRLLENGLKRKTDRDEDADHAPRLARR
jgi:AcrR family transcriptional regulator